jgi:putative membrane protein
MGITLIINVDRDNDFGRKAQIESPIIGYDANLHAASQFGIIDAEDSDLNSIYLALSTYKKLREEDEQVEIVTLCGDISVGLKSDKILAKQLEQVIEQIKAESAILISDGAEDEYILPIIQSRLKINSVIRVNVKQSRQLEDSYYRIIKMLDDDKVKKQFMLPIALILIVFSIFAIFEMAGTGFGAILFTLGLYLLVRVFRWEESIETMLSEMKSGLIAGKLSFYTYIIAIVVLGVSIFYAYNNTVFNSETLWIIPVLTFLNGITWGIVAAGLVAILGKVTDMYIHEKRIPSSYGIVPFSLFSFGFIASAIFVSLYDSITTGFTIEPFLTPYFIGYTTVGILIALIGAIILHYVKDSNEDLRNIDEITSNMLDSTE